VIRKMIMVMVKKMLGGALNALIKKLKVKKS